jgi:hypothetical protein
MISAWPLRTDITKHERYVGKVPLGDLAGLAEPRTAQRLYKLANTLAALIRNAKRRDAVSMERAINDWERDLLFLYAKYYVDFFHFGWPATSLQH